MPPEASGPAPGPHPEPPDELPRRPLPLISAGHPWFRIHRIGYAPAFFGRTGNGRFDAPTEAYGVLYVAADVECAFIETLGHTAADREVRLRVVSVADLQARGLARIVCRRSLRLVDLSGEGLHLLGADARLTTGDYLVAQRWSQALMEHPECPDGIYYRSRHDPSRFCAAIFDRVEAEIERVDLLGRLDETSVAEQIAAAMAVYGYRLVE